MSDMAKNLILWLVIAVVLMSVFQSFGPSESNGRKVDYSTFLQEVNQVKQQQEEIAQTQDILVRQNSEPEEVPAAPPATDAGGDDGDLESFSTNRSIPAPSTPALSDEQKIIQSLRPGPGKFAFRTVDGISRDTGIDARLLAVKLAGMESGGLLVKTKRNSDGAILWSLR